MGVGGRQGRVGVGEGEGIVVGMYNELKNLKKTPHIRR